MDKVRIGVIGIGAMGSAHANWLRDGNVPGAELAAVCDPSPERLKSLHGIPGYESSAELIRSGEVDAVVIATPHYSHTSIGIDALQHGLHVMMEKPISVHKADCERLIAAHKNPQQVFGAMFQLRTDPEFTKIRSLIISGELGSIKRVNWIATQWFRSDAYYASGTWRATWAGEGGGVLLNQCPHQLDLFQWMFGMPARVRAHCTLGRYHSIEVEDDVTAYMEYPDGRTAVFITSTGESPGSNRLEIACDRGRLLYENGELQFARTEVPVSEFCRKSKLGFAPPPAWDVKIPLAIPGAGAKHVGILQNFVDAILTGAPLIAPAREGIHSVELANTFLLSSMQGRTIELPLNAIEYEEHLEKLKSGSRAEKPK
ncbi:MAG: Gfo/Idh/MocA family protein [Candidatus Sumerlaeaceae bacterium]